MTSNTDFAPVSRVFEDVSLEQARRVLQLFIEREHVIPAHAHGALTQAIEDTLQKAAEIGLTSVHDLLTHTAELLRALANVFSIGEFQTAEAAATLHLYRNVILTLCIAATARYHAAEMEAVLARAPRLKKRTHEFERPLTDDEIMLCRVHVACRLAVNPRDRLAHVYGLVEAGAMTSEVSSVTLMDFDDDQAPTSVAVVGNNQVNRRTLDLDAFGTRNLSTLTTWAYRNDTPLESRLMYTGAQLTPNIGATCTAGKNITEIYTQVGITAKDITPTSLTHWRIGVIHDSAGIASALEASGRTEAGQMLRRTNLAVRERHHAVHPKRARRLTRR